MRSPVLGRVAERLPERSLPAIALDRLALTNARELALVAMGEGLSASIGTQRTLGGLFGLRLCVMSRNDRAVLLLDVPTLAAGNDVNVWHALPPPEAIAERRDTVES
jgi:hypothetical protein